MPGLTGNTALDVAIGLAFVYLLFSVLCAALQEAIAGIFDLRSAMLEKGLRTLLEDDGGAFSGGAPAAVVPAPAPGAGAAPVALGPGGARVPGPALTDQLLGHGLIRTLYRESSRGRRGPSYIPARSFAIALLDVVAPTNVDDPISAVRDTISAAEIPAGTKSALMSLANGAAHDRDHLRRLIEDWYDGAMQRVSGWYKRRAQIIICALSLLVAVGLNVNTVSIADHLLHDDAVRAAVVQQATQTTLKSGDSLDTTANDIGAVAQLGLPLGWNKPAGDPARADLTHHLARTVVGWLLTFLALSLGAPFWFDALGKIAGLRSSGARPAPAAATRA